MPEIKEWPNVPFKTWKYEKQTEMKHNVFSYYLPLWLKILGSTNKNLNFVDGFGGAGAYHTENDIKENKYNSMRFGSPIISCQTIFNLTESKKISNANVIIIDKFKDNLDNIKKILNYQKLPSDIVLFKDGEFDEVINKLLDSFEKEDSKRLAPTFFLLDPFGISGIKLSTIRRIMSMGKIEILLNFMYNSLQRWVNHDNKKIQNIYDEYFDGSDWRKCRHNCLVEKEEELVSIFRSKCKEFSKYVYPFRLRFPYKEMTYYYLFHLSNHWQGCSLMKDSFAAFNKGRTEYKGENYLSHLFEGLDKKEKRENFQEKLIQHFKGKTIHCKNIYEKFIDETDLLIREIKKILNKLEKDKLILVKACDGRKRRGGFKDFDLIKFV